MEQLPSFNPKSNSQNRPAAQNAKAVGRGTKPRPRNTTNETSANPKAPMAIPPKRVPLSARPSAANIQTQNERPENGNAINQQPRSYAPQERYSTSQEATRPAVSYPPQRRDVSQPRVAASNISAAANSELDFGQENATSSRPEENASNLKLRRPKKIFRKILIFLLVLVLLACFWVFFLVNTGNKNLSYTDALSGRADTPGTTYLIVGSDERTANEDATEGQRSDSIMLLHKNGDQAALISLPRDSFVEIPGVGGQKINAAFSLGGAPLLVQTVENLTGLTVDHYIQIGMNGLVELTDAVGGVTLCYDQDVNDEKSHLNWTAGCHAVDGETALAFARMRYSDPLGDIGRAQRQRQVVSAILKKAASKETVLSPSRQYALTKSGAKVLGVDQDTSITDVAWAGWYIKQSLGSNGIMGTPPISDLNYYPGGIGSTVRLDPERIDQFWADLRDGNLSVEQYETLAKN